MATITNTVGLLSMNDNAVRFNLNRQLSDSLVKVLDPNGVHVLQFSMVHNDDHMRGLWLTKIEGEKDPVEVWIDCSFTTFDLCTTTVSDERPTEDDE